nr:MULTISPECIES: alanine racemase [Staphylococcus]
MCFRCLCSYLLREIDFRKVTIVSDKYFRSTELTIDLDAITDNYHALVKLQPNKLIMPVVKANAYGLGSIQIATHLRDLGAEFFCVATLDEAIELRMHGIKEKILILSSVPPHAINKAIQHRVAIGVPSKEWLERAIAHIDEEAKKNVWMHIKLDTGMNRLGIKDAETYHEVIQLIEQHPNLKFEGVFSHFSSADDDNDTSKLQYERFKTLVESTQQPPYVHIQNSAGALRFDPSICNAFRPGIALYGYYPSSFIEEKVTAKLRPSLQWTSAITQVKTLEPGENIGYGETYTAEKAMTIALLPVGYADGYIRSMQGSDVKVNGHQCKVVGRVSMDQTAIHVPETTQPGDIVTLIEPIAHSPQSVEALATQQNTINYEVLCNLSRRVARIYKTQQLCEISNELLK